MATIGCIKSKMGTTTYYICKMAAGQLIDSVGIANELPEWDNMTAEEKMQREYDIRRIVDEIVPYVVNDEDRFFSSLIVDIYKGFEDISFEAISDVIKDMPMAYQGPMKDMGFLTLPGKERLIALDGQHRLLSLKIAIRGKSGVPGGIKPFAGISSLVPHPELANEELSVILVEHTSNSKIRKIFNKINKYAKQTSRSDNIITSEDDTYAVISRRMNKDDGPLAPIGPIELVNWKSNTLPQRSKNLTTMSTIYITAETLLHEKGYKTTELPSDDEIEEAYQIVASFWRICLERINIYREYIGLTKQDKPVSTLREQNLLMKPVTQMALAYVAAAAAKKGLAWVDVVDKLNDIDWSFSNPLWFNILVIGSATKKMITGKEAIRSAGKVISYMAFGKHLTTSEVNEVRKIIQDANNDESAELPAIIE